MPPESLLAEEPWRVSDAQKEQFIREGYVIARGLIPPQIVAATRDNLLAALGLDPADPRTWQGKNSVVSDRAILALTEPCRTKGIEQVAAQIAGPNFLPGVGFSPYLESKGEADALMRGYIPVLNFPQPGPREFVKPTGYHIDGMHRTTTWPDKFFLIVFAYLTDTADYGGATTILPGSHRQVFEHWVKTGHPGSTHPPMELPFADPLPMPGRAGDVIFLHYLAVHSGSPNRSDHIRVGLNTAVLPNPARPYQPKPGPAALDWTPLDHTLRTDNLDA